MAGAGCSVSGHKDWLWITVKVIGPECPERAPEHTDPLTGLQPHTWGGSRGHPDGQRDWEAPCGVSVTIPQQAASLLSLCLREEVGHGEMQTSG